MDPSERTVYDALQEPGRLDGLVDQSLRSIFRSGGTIENLAIVLLRCFWLEEVRSAAVGASASNRVVVASKARQGLASRLGLGALSDQRPSGFELAIPALREWPYSSPVLGEFRPTVVFALHRLHLKGILREE